MTKQAKNDVVRMLIVDDDPDTAASVRRLLSKKFRSVVEVAATVSTARDRLKAETFDILILDYNLPDGTGLDLLEELSCSGDHPPVIMVTGQGDESIASEALRLRASGYVVKDRRLPAALPEAVSGALSEIALRRAEERIRYSEETERALLNAAPESLFLLDPSGTILQANRTGAERFGLGGDEARGRNFYQLLPEGLRVERKRHIDSVFRTGQTLHFNDVREGRDYSNAVFPVLGESGDIERVAYTARDVTSQKRAEAVMEEARDELEAMVQQRTAELLATNRELRDEITMRMRVEESLKTLSAQVHGQARMLDQILSSSPDHFFLFDRKGKFIYANSTAAGVLGLDHAEMEGKYWWDLGLPEEPMKSLDIQREAVLASGEQRVGRMVLPTPGGERDFEYVLSPIMGLDNKANTVVATLRDITSEDRLREELESHMGVLEERAQLLDLMPCAVILRDMNDEVLHWSAGAEKMYGWSSNEVVGKSCHEMLRTEFPVPVGDIGFELLETGSWEGRLIKFASDGSRVDVQSRWVLKRLAQGQPDAVLEIDDSRGVQPPLS